MTKISNLFNDFFVSIIESTADENQATSSWDKSLAEVMLTYKDHLIIKSNKEQLKLASCLSTTLIWESQWTVPVWWLKSANLEYPNCPNQVKMSRNFVNLDFINFPNIKNSLKKWGLVTRMPYDQSF